MRYRLIFTILGIVVLLLLGYLVLKIYNVTESRQEVRELQKEIDSSNEEKVELLYGYNIEKLKVETGEVGRNETLAEILMQYRNINHKTVYDITVASKDVYDFRTIRRGHSYTALIPKGYIDSVTAFVYEISSLEFVVIDLQEGVKVFRGKKEVTNKLMRSTGFVNTSLWDYTKEQNVPFELALKLSDIYDWTVDFFRLDKGDSFSIIYDLQSVGEKVIGIGDIYCAKLMHRGETYYAFRYPIDDDYAYFDEDGMSLEKQFLKSPLRYSRISSGFSNRRYHPVLKRYRAHHGIDYAAPHGTPVRSIGDGVITKRAYQARGGGNYLRVKHTSTYSSVYMHLSRFAKGIKQGSKVKQGDVIGYVGSTGLSTGPHLDFRIRKHGSYINPLTMKSPPERPIPEAEKELYLSHIDSVRHLLIGGDNSTTPLIPDLLN